MVKKVVLEFIFECSQHDSHSSVVASQGTPFQIPTSFSHLSFWRQVTMALLWAVPQKSIPRTGPKALIPTFQKKAEGHYLKRCKEGRCAQCTVNSTLEYNERQRKLHLKCFPIYHGLE